MRRMRLVRRVLVRFGEIENRRRALLFEATACLVAARVALIFVPFQSVARRLGTFVPPTDARVQDARTKMSQEQTRLAEDIGWAVTRSARYMPFKALCLAQAIAAHRMLKRRGIASVMHFGVAKGREKTINAHAWLDASGVEVTGYPPGREFTELACFVSSRPSTR